MADKRIFQLTQATSVPSGSKFVMDEYDGVSAFTTKHIDYADLLAGIQDETPTIYSANGTLSGTRTVTQSGYTLSFQGGQVSMTGVAGVPTLSIGSPNRSCIFGSNNISGINGATFVGQNAATGGYGMFGNAVSLGGGIGIHGRGSQYGIQADTLNSISGSFAAKFTGDTIAGALFSSGKTFYQVPSDPSPSPSHDSRGYYTSSADINERFANGSNNSALEIYGSRGAKFFLDVQMLYLRTNLINNAADTVNIAQYDDATAYWSMLRNIKFPEFIRLGSATETFIRDDSDQPIMSWRKDNRLTKVHSILEMLGLPTSSPGITKRVFMVDRGDGTSDLRIVN